MENHRLVPLHLLSSSYEFDDRNISYFVGPNGMPPRDHQYENHSYHKRSFYDGVFQQPTQYNGKTDHKTIIVIL